MVQKVSISTKIKNPTHTHSKSGNISPNSEAQTKNPTGTCAPNSAGRSHTPEVCRNPRRRIVFGAPLKSLRKPLGSDASGCRQTCSFRPAGVTPEDVCTALPVTIDLTIIAKALCCAARGRDVT